MSIIELKPCPFCGGNKLVRSVDGGCLPSFIERDHFTTEEILLKTPYVTSCQLMCESCGASVEGYATSDNLNDDIYNKAVDDCYKKWNRRTSE